MANKNLTVAEITDGALQDAAVTTLSQSIVLQEVQQYNDEFPQRRISDVTITLKDGRVLQSGPTEADGDPESPMSETEIVKKFHKFASPAVGDDTSKKLATKILGMGHTDQTLEDFFSLIFPPMDNQ